MFGQSSTRASLSATCRHVIEEGCAPATNDVVSSECGCEEQYQRVTIAQLWTHTPKLSARPLDWLPNPRLQHRGGEWSAVAGTSLRCGPTNVGGAARSNPRLAEPESTTGQMPRRALGPDTFGHELHLECSVRPAAQHACIRPPLRRDVDRDDGRHAAFHGHSGGDAVAESAAPGRHGPGHDPAHDWLDARTRPRLEAWRRNVGRDAAALGRGPGNGGPGRHDGDALARAGGRTGHVSGHAGGDAASTGSPRPYAPSGPAFRTTLVATDLPRYCLLERDRAGARHCQVRRKNSAW
jgi:hypothetical protein